MMKNLITQSMSRRGNCYDNVTMENPLGLFKNERVHHLRLKTRAETIQAITEYIRFFISDNANRLDWAIYRQSHLNANSMKKGWLHEPVRIHY